jgi:hypothetical protein
MFLSLARPIQSTSPHPTSPRSILILSTLLRLGLPSGLLGGSLSPQHGASSGYGWRNGLQLWRLAANILNSSRGQTIRGGPPAWGLGVGLTTLHHKNELVTKNLTEPRIWTDSLDKRLRVSNKLKLLFSLSLSLSPSKTSCLSSCLMIIGALPSTGDRVSIEEAIER